MSPLVMKMSMTGKKGDLIHVPKPLRGAASAKAENAAVTIQANTEEELTIPVDRHFEYSRFIEDIVETQALSSLRQFYTSDAGYQLARQVDSDLLNCGTGFGDGGTRVLDNPAVSDWTHSNSYMIDTTVTSSNLAAYADNGVADTDAFTELAFRSLIKLMDDNDVPMENRNFVIPPSARRTIMGIERFVSSDFVTGRPVETGYIGNLFGVDFYVSSNCPVIEAAGDNTAGGDVRAALFFHKDAIVHAEQLAVRSQTQYKQEYLSTLYTADTLYGVQVYRPEAGFVLALPNA